MDLATEVARNVLVLTIYFIVVALVFNRAFQSLDKLVNFETDSAYLNKELSANKLQDILNVKFSFAEKYELDELHRLCMSIENKSKDVFVEIDWKQCFISDFDKRIRRAIRVIPGKNEAAAQSPSTILPGQTLKEEISDEKIGSPLFDPKKLQAAADKTDYFYLRLFLKISEANVGGRSCNLRCQFIAKNLSWQKALALALQPK
ncbi:hypothetical protein [Coleofasciculus sp.]|uniref:hypothetical protein n=1 Tax=Coleofasciculus sp. TaxID=3100458 RepID=UPI0039F7F20A